MEFLRQIWIIFIAGGIGISSCSPPAPILFNRPSYGCNWPEGGGGPSRASTAAVQVATIPHLIWKRHFKTALLVEPTSAMGALAVPATNRKLYLLSAKSGALLAEIETGDPVVAPVCLEDTLAVINEFGRHLTIENWVRRKVMWRADLKGSETEPLIFKGRLYWREGTSNVNCFDLQEGRRVWEKRLDFAFSAPSAACSLGFVLASKEGLVNCLSPEDGNLRWSFETGGRMRNSPVIYADDLVYCTVDGKVGQLSMDNGTQIWAMNIETAVVAPIATDGDGVYIGAGDGTLVKLDFKTGEVLWKLQVGGPIKAGVTIAGDLAVFASLDYSVYFVDKKQGTVSLEHKTEGMLSARPLACDDYVYVAGEDKNLYCFQFAKGQ